jgi:tetratricopeptide (TPR) repeat protein
LRIAGVCLAYALSHEESHMADYSLSLDIADDPRWFAAPSYSTSVARALTQAYAIMKRHTTRVRSFTSASAIMFPFVNTPMSPEQRIRLNYVMGLSLAADGAYPVALPWLDDALDLAVQLDDFGAIAQLSFLHGLADNALMQYSEAIEHHRVSLDALIELDNRLSPAASSLELSTLLCLAQFEYMAGKFELSGLRTEQAKRHLRRAPDNQSLEAANLAWVEAALSRLRGEPDRALQKALVAAELSGGTATLLNQGRLNTFVAECALQLADILPLAHPRHYVVTNLAHTFAEEAIRIAIKASDAEGLGMGLLARTRYKRALDHSFDHLSTIAAVEEIAWQRNDHALLGRVHTARGDEMMARDETESALNCYRKAIAVLDNGEAYALSVWPRRALYRYQEMHV